MVLPINKRRTWLGNTFTSSASTTILAPRKQSCPGLMTTFLVSTMTTSRLKSNTCSWIAAASRRSVKHQLWLLDAPTPKKRGIIGRPAYLSKRAHSNALFGLGTRCSDLPAQWRHPSAAHLRYQSHPPSVRSIEVSITRSSSPSTSLTTCPLSQDIISILA
jgi:hypothetical protein